MKLHSPLIGLVLFVLLTGKAMAIEEPRYEVIVSDGPYEVRRYAPMLVAETIVDGDMDEASNKGFRLIADFIFGNNQRADAESSAKIAMTAPVTVQPQPTKIAMTAPVELDLDPTLPPSIDTLSYPGFPRAVTYAKFPLLGINSYFGWYPGPNGTVADRSLLSDYLDQVRACYPNKALVITDLERLQRLVDNASSL